MQCCGLTGLWIVTGLVDTILPIVLCPHTARYAQQPGAVSASAAWRIALWLFPKQKVNSFHPKRFALPLSSPPSRPLLRHRNSGFFFPLPRFQHSPCCACKLNPGAGARPLKTIPEALANGWESFKAGVSESASLPPCSLLSMQLQDTQSKLSTFTMHN